MSNKTQNIAKVQVAGGQVVVLPVSGRKKPEIPSFLMDKWQNIVDLAAKSIGVPAGLLMRISAEEIEVAVASQTVGNPYSVEDKEKLGMGLYCETVLGTRETLHVPNALDDELWATNPDIKLNMISYLGMPIKWPDGELFGTICILDSRARQYSDTHIQLMAHFRNSVETDLRMLLEREDFKRLSVEKDLALREAHHRIKNHLNMLSGMLQLNMYNVGTDESAAVVSETLLGDMVSRIRAIAELHSHIALAEHAQVELSTFLETVCRTIVESISDKDVALTFSADRFNVSRRIFFHAGLLVSELITNALKHAFDGVDRPEISVVLTDTDEDMFTLTFRDNGGGMCSTVVPELCESIGMTLISDLPKRMGGSYTVNADNGTLYTFILEKDDRV